MTTLAERVQRIASDLDCGLGDVDAVKCRLRDTLDVIAELVGVMDKSVTHARRKDAAGVLCGRPVFDGEAPLFYASFESGKRDEVALNAVDCPTCREIVLRWPEYHAEWERAASAHAKSKAAPEPRRRAYATELAGWRDWLCRQPIVNEVSQEALDELARALAAVRRAP